MGRRHKVLVGRASAAAAVAATVVIAVVLVMAAQARERNEQMLRKNAETERTRAEHNEAEAARQRDILASSRNTRSALGDRFENSALFRLSRELSRPVN